MAKQAGKTKSVKVTLTDPKPKKSVTRFDCEEDDAALTSVYVSKDALAKLGDPDSIVVTIEAA